MSLQLSARAQPAPRPLGCPRCNGPVDVKSRHVAVSGSAVKIYCSDACLRGVVPPPRDEPVEVPIVVEDPPRRLAWLLAAGLVVGGTYVIVHYAGGRADEDATEAAVQPWTPSIPAPPALPPPPREPTPEQRADEALLAELKQDLWIHPLAGPRRRMPINHTAAFGAARAVDPPPECLSGHCGVDVGGTIWGEPVHAVHEGVVDWVNRGPNDEHGGVFVKISHRGGTLFSWYFHLAAVPRWVQPGAKVSLGRVVGLLGDTGVKNSGPHLHFAMTVKAPNARRERYVDPEPLIAIWPLWIADPDKPGGHVSTVEPVGMPVRVPNKMKTRSAPAAPDVAAGSNEPAPAPVSAPEAPAPDPAASSTSSGGALTN